MAVDAEGEDHFWVQVDKGKKQRMKRGSHLTIGMVQFPLLFLQTDDDVLKIFVVTRPVYGTCHNKDFKVIIMQITHTIVRWPSCGNLSVILNLPLK